MRATLLARVRELLARAGFYLSAEAAMRPLAFDVIARRDGQLLIVKVLTNVDGLNEPVAQELRLLASFLEATPLVVGERTSSRPLEPGAVYARYGVSIVAFETLSDYLQEGVAPLVYAAPGGFYVNLDGARLRALREARGLSLGDLAQAAGVSRRAIGMYEEGMGAMVDVAARLEEFLDEPLALPNDPFQPAKPEDAELAGPAPSFDPLTFEGAILRALGEMGFRVAQTQKSPFAAIGRDQDDVLLTGFSDGSPDTAKRAAATANVSEVAETWGVFFVERTTTRMSIEGTPVVSREEIVRFGDADQLIKLLEERRGKKR